MIFNAYGLYTVHKLYIYIYMELMNGAISQCLGGLEPQTN